MQFHAQDSHIKPFGVGVRFVEIGAVKATLYVKAWKKFDLYFYTLPFIFIKLGTDDSPPPQTSWGKAVKLMETASNYTVSY
jgi:hypothetical protein